jgi:hypothetical protein
VSLWLAADIMERTPSAVLVEYRGLFGGLPVTSVQRVTLRPPGRVEFRQVRGTLLSLTGAFVLKDAQGDTDLTLVLAVDAGVALLSETAVQQILVGGIESTLSKVKATAERDLVRVVTRRGQAAAETGSQAEADAEPDQADTPGDAEAQDGNDETGPPGAGEPPAPAAAGLGAGAPGAGAPPAATPAAATPALPANARPKGSRRRRRRRGGGPRPPASGAGT